jgi:hypothetical protein
MTTAVIHNNCAAAAVVVAAGILIGVATKFFLGRVKVPYTALLLVRVC